MLAQWCVIADRLNLTNWIRIYDVFTCNESYGQREERSSEASDIVYGETCSHTHMRYIRERENGQGFFIWRGKIVGTTWSNVKEWEREKRVSKDPFNLIPHRNNLRFFFSLSLPFSFLIQLVLSFALSHRRSYMSEEKVAFLRSNHLCLALSGSPFINPWKKWKGSYTNNPSF